jgi:RNA polymerase sigma-70 factor (ECF subfamily)
MYESVLLSDQELLKAFKSGNERALEQIIYKYKDKVFSTIMFLVKDRALAEDIFQEVFIKVIKTLRAGKYNEEGKLSQWLLRVAYNLCIDHFRKVKRSPKMTAADGSEVIEYSIISNNNAEKAMIQSEMCANVQYVIDQLSPNQKEVVVLRHFADLSFKEIAKMTNVSINTALGRMRYALANMRKFIEENNVPI